MAIYFSAPCCLLRMSLLVTACIGLVLYMNGQGLLSDYNFNVFMALGTKTLWIVEVKECLKCMELNASLWIILLIIRCVKSYVQQVVVFVLFYKENI